MYITFFPLFVVLQQPTSARAVWIIGKDSFHICWTSTLPQGSYYRILNSQYEELNRTAHDVNQPTYSINTTSQHSIADTFVLIQAVSFMQMQTLPSRPFRVNLSGQLKL